MAIVILFVKIPNWKEQSKYVQKMDKYIWYSHTIECHTAMKNKLITVQLYVQMFMSFRNIILLEKKLQKNANGMISSI